MESGRVRALQDWLRDRSRTPLSRLALQWFRGYFEASRNSGCAAGLYSTLSVLPAALVFVACVHPTENGANAFADHLVAHMKLTGATADLVDGTFGSASANALAATLTVMVTFLIWGIGIGQIYQDVYARAWGVKVRSIADQGRFAIFFFVLAGAVSLAVLSAARLHTAGWLVLLPVWFVAATIFWLWVPMFLLHRQVALRALLPGALMGAFVIGGTIATSPWWLGPTVNANAKAFGSFGVVLTMTTYVFILVTISLVCAVFSPVWVEWRRAQREARGEGSPRAAESLVVP
jgi:hypothetical protein